MRCRQWLWVLEVPLLLGVGSGSAYAIGNFGLSSPTNGGWVAGTPTLRWGAASGATSYTLTLTPTFGTPLIKTGLTSTSYTLMATEALSTAAGPYTWNVTGYDTTGASANSGTWSFFVDTAPPNAFSLTGPEANAWTSTGQALVTWESATDSGSGIAAYHLYMDGKLCRDEAASATGAGFYPATPCVAAEGLHYWAVSVEDKVGNLTWCSQAPGGSPGIPFRIDDTGPADPAISGGVFQLSSRNIPNYYGHPNDNMLDTGINVQAGEEVTVTSSGTWCFLSCSLGCFRTAGEYSPTGGGVPAPDCYDYALIARIGASFYCVGQNATFLASSAGKLYLGANAETTGCSTPTVTATVSGGRAFNLVSPSDGAVTAERTPTFAWQPASDLGAGGVNYRLAVDVANSSTTEMQHVTTTGTSATITEPLHDGVWEWSVKAIDAVRNSTESVMRTFRVDTLRPEPFRLSLPGDGECTTLPTPSLCWDSAKDDSGIAAQHLWLDGVLANATASSCTTPSVALSQGQHSWYVVQIDRAGLARQSSDTRTFWVDYTAPAAPTLTGPAQGATLADPPRFGWNAASDNTGIKSYELYVDGKLTASVDAATLGYLPPTDLPVGNHSWYLRAIDRCGQATQSATWSFSMTACSVDGQAHPCPGYERGACRPGIRSCTAPGSWSACSDVVGPVTEACNGIDDDCDGIIDNASGATANNSCGGICASVTPPYLWSECDGPDLDGCAEGHIVCDGLNATVCVETTPNNVEICNGRDDDCNGIVDDPPVCTQLGSGGTSGIGGGMGLGGSTNTGAAPGSSVLGLGGVATSGTSDVGGATTASGAAWSGGQSNAIAAGSTLGAGNGSILSGASGYSAGANANSGIVTLGGAASLTKDSAAASMAGAATDSSGRAGSGNSNHAAAQWAGQDGLGVKAENAAKDPESGCNCQVASASKTNGSVFALLGVLAWLLGRRRTRPGRAMGSFRGSCS